jgi:hypothetical protein
MPYIIAILITLWGSTAFAQTSGCMKCVFNPPTCEGVLSVRDRLDQEARAKGWTDEFPKNYWKDAAEERKRLIRDYCK